MGEGAGIYVGETAGLQPSLNINNNNIDCHSFGLYSIGSCKFELRNNYIFDNWVGGIYIQSAKEIDIHDNTIQRNGIKSGLLGGLNGIHIVRVTGNCDISNNIIIGNIIHGVYIGLSSFKSSVSENDFLFNRINACSHDSYTFWYGNFWNRPRLIKLIPRTMTTPFGIKRIPQFDLNPAFLPNFLRL